jgi:hypothetical protein
MLADESAGIDTALVSGAHVVYLTPQIPAGLNLNDIWAVQADGTDRHLVLHDPTHEHGLMDVIGPWVLYTEHPTTLPKPSSLASIQLTGVAPRIVMAAIGQGELWQQPNYQRQVGGRAVIELAGNFFSLLPDGTDLRQLTTYPPFPHLNNEPFTVLLSIVGVVGDKLIYPTMLSPSSPTSPEGTPELFAVPVLGGSVVKLGNGPEMEIFGTVVGTRVVYNRCMLIDLPNFDVGFDQCDAVSVRSDGQGRVALTATPDINYVQGCHWRAGDNPA